MACGFSGPAATTGTGGVSTTPGAGNGTMPGAGTTTNPGGGNNPGTGGSGTMPGGGNGTTGGDTTTSGAGPVGGADATGGNGPAASNNVEYTGTWPTAPIKYPKPAAGALTYKKKLIHNQFLAESCSIADYNNDGKVDVSSGRIWYEGPAFTTQHTFRDGHGPLPRDGASEELNTGVSDDWADYPFDVNHDGFTDIINVAQCDVPETGDPTDANKRGTPNKIGTGPQAHASAVWYQNPGAAGIAAPDSKWTSHLIHADVRLEQHGLVDMNKDGFPEIYGACKDCTPSETKGYYQGDPANPMAQWVYHPVTIHYTFPFGDLGWMHGEGAGDVNGDGWPDLLERGGAWLQSATGGMWSATVTAANTKPATGGWVKTDLYDGLADGAGNKGASHMYAADMDGDGLTDIVAADWAHGEGLAWYKQGTDGTFKKYYFMHTQADAAMYGNVYFTEPHALQVVDMNGDGRPDVVTGKMRFAHPLDQHDPDPTGVPYIYVFENLAMPGANGSPITLKPVLVDPQPPVGALGTPEGGMGVGRQLAVGYIGTPAMDGTNDAILDICVGTKVGLAIFIGQ